MESFFLAETLKYHYLLQAPVQDHGIDILQSHVFNTEVRVCAHVCACCRCMLYV